MQPANRLLLVTLGTMALAGCGGGTSMLSDTPVDRPLAPTLASGNSGTNSGMEGRWILTAPNAPPCGLTLTGGPAASEGRVTPDGGCPARFFLARRWKLADGGLTVVDGDGEPLASFRNVGDRYDGKSIAETPLTLAR